MKDKKFLKEVITILIIGAIINGFCFFICSITGHCANETNEYFPMTQNDKNFPMTEVFNYVSADFQHNENLDDYYCFMNCWNDLSGRWHGYIIFTDFDVMAELNSSGTSFNMQNATTSGHTMYAYEYQCGTTYSWKNVWSRGTNTIQGLNFESSLYNSHVSYLSNYQVDFYVYDYACLLSPDSSISVGDFSDLPNIDEILNNIQNNWEPPSTVTGHALPSTPQENSNNTDFQNRLQMFQYLADTITQNFGNLGYNLAKWFDGLQSKLTQGFNSVSQNIYNGFKTLMDNIKDFFGAKLDFIIEKIAYITEEPDPEEIQDYFESTSAYTDISSIQTSANSFVTSFTGVSEPNDYVITFHVEDISILNQSQPFLLHLNILNPVKTYIRGFLWVVVSYGIFISILDSLPNYINGGGGEDD